MDSVYDTVCKAQNGVGSAFPDGEWRYIVNSSYIMWSDEYQCRIVMRGQGGGNILVGIEFNWRVVRKPRYMTDNTYYEISMLGYDGGHIASWVVDRINEHICMSVMGT